MLNNNRLRGGSSSVREVRSDDVDDTDAEPPAGSRLRDRLRADRTRADRRTDARLVRDDEADRDGDGIRDGDERRDDVVDDVVIEEHPGELGVREARRRFGGLDIPASLAGMMAAFGLTVLLGGLFAAVGSIGYQFDVERNGEKLSTGGMIAGVFTLIVAFLFGGWVAGRMARYDGGRNGLMSAVWFVVLGAVLALLGGAVGEQYDVFANVAVPRWFSDNVWTPAALISAIAAFVLMLVAGYLGGAIGAGYHKQADRAIVTTSDAVVTRERSARGVRPRRRIFS